jgi:hypothetical protein
MDDEYEEKSEIALAIEQRERKLHPFDVRGFLGLGDKEIPKLAIRYLLKHEENLALVAAHASAKEYARDDNDARSDAELLDDLKLAEALQRACYVDGKTTKQGHPIQAFPGGRWMEKNFSTEQIAILHNLQFEVRKAEHPLLWDIELEDVRAVAEGCARTRETDIPEAMLARYSREHLTTAFVLLAGEWWTLKEKQRMVDEALREAEDVPGEGGLGGGEPRGEDDLEAERDPGDHAPPREEGG